MKTYLFSLLFILLSCSCFSQDKQAILKVLESQRQAWNRGDITAYMQGYWKSDSLVFVGKTGPKYGWKTTLDNYKKHYPNKAAMGTLDFKVIKLQLLDTQNAFMLGAWNLKREKDSLGGYFTLWFRKFKDGWKVVADHSS